MDNNMWDIFFLSTIPSREQDSTNKQTGAAARKNTATKNRAPLVLHFSQILLIYINKSGPPFFTCTDELHMCNHRISSIDKTRNDYWFDLRTNGESPHSSTRQPDPENTRNKADEIWSDLIWSDRKKVILSFWLSFFQPRWLSSGSF